MTSGPVLLMCLEGENAVLLNREIMGATDPAKAAPGTIRKDFADSIEANAVHGSDSPKSAEREIAYFFEKRRSRSASESRRCVDENRASLRSIRSSGFRGQCRENQRSI